MLTCGDRFYVMNVSVVDTMEVETVSSLSPAWYVAASVLEL